jgi:hypothetical protein
MRYDISVHSTHGSNRLIDVTGQRFGRLLIIKRTYSDRYHARWVAKCDCGNLTSVRSDRLISKKTRSCGCLRKDLRTSSQQAVIRYDTPH